MQKEPVFFNRPQEAPENLLLLPPVPLSHGGQLLRAKIRDAFNFTDHPELELDASGRKLVRFRCDCPDYRASESFCPHCKALLLAAAPELLCPDAVAVTEDPEELPTEEPAREEEELPDLSDIYSLSDFSYLFCNCGAHLYPGVRRPRIPLARYIQALGDSQKTRQLAKAYWNGSCFGISTTAAMFHESHEGTCITDFREDARLPMDLRLTDRHPGLNMTLHQYIELMQVLVLSPAVQAAVNLTFHGENNMQALAELTDAFQMGLMPPTVLCVLKNAAGAGGHAMVPYALKRTDTGEDTVLLYDPNQPYDPQDPEQVKTFVLEKDASGNYVNWRFLMNGTTLYSEETGGKICFVPYEVYTEAWNNRSCAAPNDNGLLSVAAGIAIKDAHGTVLARVTEAGVESCRKEIYQIIPMGGPEEAAEFLVSLPGGLYVLSLEDPALEELSAVLAGTELSLELHTTAREATLLLDDAEKLAEVRICQEGSSYSAEICSALGSEEVRTVLSGTVDAEPLRLIRKDGVLYGAGLTDRCSLLINDDFCPLSTVRPLTEDRIPEETEQELILNHTSEKGEAASEES